MRRRGLEEVRIRKTVSVGNRVIQRGEKNKGRKNMKRLRSTTLTEKIEGCPQTSQRERETSAGTWQGSCSLANCPRMCRIRSFFHL